MWKRASSSCASWSSRRGGFAGDIVPDARPEEGRGCMCIRDRAAASPPGSDWPGACSDSARAVGDDGSVRSRMRNGASTAGATWRICTPGDDGLRCWESSDWRRFVCGCEGLNESSGVAGEALPETSVGLAPRSLRASPPSLLHSACRKSPVGIAALAD